MSHFSMCARPFPWVLEYIGAYAPQYYKFGSDIFLQLNSPKKEFLCSLNSHKICSLSVGYVQSCGEPAQGVSLESLLVSPGHFMSPSDGHDLCLQCLGPAPVLFSWRWMRSCCKSWKSPFSARTRYTSSSILTILGIVWNFCPRLVNLPHHWWQGLTMPLARPSSPCLPWQSCKYTKSTPNHWEICTRVVLFQIRGRNCARPLTTPSGLQKLWWKQWVRWRPLQWSRSATCGWMWDAEKVSFLEAPISQGSLIGDTVKAFAQQFSTVKKQVEAIKYN